MARSKTEVWDTYQVKKSKFNIGDEVYSYQNKDYPAEIARKNFSPWESISKPHENDTWQYIVKLKDGSRSKWMDERSVFATRQADEKYGLGGVLSKFKGKANDYFARAKHKVHGHVNKEKITKMLDDAKVKFKAEAKKVKNRVNYEIEHHKHEFVLDYLKKYADTPGLSAEEKGEIMDVRILMMDVYPEMKMEMGGTIPGSVPAGVPDAQHKAKEFVKEHPEVLLEHGGVVSGDRKKIEEIDGALRRYTSWNEKKLPGDSEILSQAANDGYVRIISATQAEWTEEGLKRLHNAIPNNYEGKTPDGVWNAWSPKQRAHFLHDHEYLGISSFNEQKPFIRKSFDELPQNIQAAVKSHIHQGQYEGGGTVELDDTERELQLYIENDGDLYRQQFIPICTNLITKVARGTYDHEKAAQLFKYLVEAADKKYQSEFGTPGAKGFMLTVSQRKNLSKVLADEFLSAAKAGEYDYLLPKKYQGKKLFKSGGTVDSWKKKALSELKAEADDKKLKAAHTEVGYVHDDDSMVVESGNCEYYVFKNSETAEKYAVEKVKNDLESEPEIFEQGWLQNHLHVTDTDRRIIANEEADRYVGDIKEEDEGRRLIEEANMDVYEFNDADETRRQEMLDEAESTVHDDYYNTWYRGLQNPISFLCEEQGIYTPEDLMKQSWIRIDEEEAAKDAVNTDGTAHFIASYDGEEIQLPSGAVAYRLN